MQMIRGGENHAVRTLLGEQLGQRRVQRHPGGCGQFGSGRGRVDQGAELAGVAGLDQFNMTPTDQAGTGDGDA
ncbi:hypothetical protein D3C75_1288130 [compost metagenome]